MKKTAQGKVNFFLMILVFLIIAAIFAYALYLERKALQPVAESSSQTQVFFCPDDGCENIFTEAVEKAGKVECTLYDLDSEKLINALKQKQQSDPKQITLLIESDNSEEAEAAGLVFEKDKNKNYMHHKFCILDGQYVITGSTNPTDNCFNKNNNNLLIINSSKIAQNYEHELAALLENRYNERKTQNPKVMLNNKLYKNYFCPQDSCKEHVLAELNKAQQSIYFMTFSFTDDDIGDLLAIKKKQGLDIAGVMETSQKSQWSEYEKLKANNVNVTYDKNPATMHHKVFIIDGKTVITGSYNPTANGDENNNENIIIIDDPSIAEMFLEEFGRLR